MFFLTYLRRELRRRMRQAVFVALGLAVGIGLVVTVTAASAGVRGAQATVLHALYGIGTDVTVTKAAEPLDPTKQGPGANAFSPGAAEQDVDVLGLPPGLDLLDAADADRATKLHGVAAAAGGLNLVDSKLTVPAVKDLGPGGKYSHGLPPASTFNVTGVDPGHLRLGPYGSAELSAGRSLTKADASANVAVVDYGYARENRLIVGSTVTVARTGFTVIGIVRQSKGGGAADVYLPLARAQALSRFHDLDSLTGKVDAVYVSAASGATVHNVQKALSAMLPKATVTSSSSLADAVTGSLASAAGLAADLGRWLAIAVLIASFAVASVLTMAAVSRRVREFGTLKALGWRSRRIVGQLLGESLVIGLIGAVLGTALGFAGAAAVRLAAPKLSATVAQNPGSSPPENVSINSNGMSHHIAEGGTHTVTVHLTAPVTLAAIGLAVALALAGGLISGSFGGWRAARLRPARALGRVA
ncbi:MAG: ABC transporter permease [Mycobacteriales bacterium]